MHASVPPYGMPASRHEALEATALREDLCSWAGHSGSVLCVLRQVIRDLPQDRSKQALPAQMRHKPLIRMARTYRCLPLLSDAVRNAAPASSSTLWPVEPISSSTTAAHPPVQGVISLGLLKLRHELLVRRDVDAQLRAQLS